MFTRTLNHSRMALPDMPSLGRKANNVEVWTDTPQEGQPYHVVLNVEDKDSMNCVDLLPDEARAVAHMLLAAANHVFPS